MKKVKTRLTPTPSGYLHQGNVYNFILNWWYARAHQGSVILRIDDYDQSRCRDHFIDDIFNVLDVLGLDYDDGPKDRIDFKSNFSQSLKTQHYKNVLNEFDQKYVCLCSRKDIMNRTNLSYDGYCRKKEHQFIESKSTYRFINNKDNGSEDFHLWRKESIPSYHLMNVIEDHEQSITHIIRGNDLKESTMFHRHLAMEMKLEFPSDENCYHHSLIEFDNGKKMAKSQNAPSVFQKITSDNGVRELFHDFCQFFSLDKVDNLADLIKYHDFSKIDWNV